MIIFIQQKKKLIFLTIAQNEEGIYRLSGSASTIQALKDRFNNGMNNNLEMKLLTY